MVWDGPLDLLKSFLLDLNHNDYNLSFTHSIYQEFLPFLDTYIKKDKGWPPAQWSLQETIIRQQYSSLQ